MTQSVIIGKISSALTQNLTAFNIDNDAFPQLFNAYVWRGRVKRKRGTSLLGRLQRQLSAQAGAAVNIASPSGSFSLITSLGIQANSSIVLGNKVNITILVGGQALTDTTGTGILTVAAGNITAATINYATGIVSYTATAPAASQSIVFTGSYFPSLPVMGLRDFLNFTSGQSAFLPTSSYPLQVSFDQTYSYQINQSVFPPFFYDVSYYKATELPVTWSGADYQQFWTTNYSSALWATNGTPGLHFLNGSYTSGSGSAVITFNFKSGGSNFTTLIDGDVLWFNEWPGGSSINGVSGIVTTDTDAANGNYVVTFTETQTVSGTGIVQLMTNSVPAAGDGIRWYDGDPTNGTGIPTGSGFGWVNFAPPLTATLVEINNEVAGLYYLVGATAIVPYKDRLLFFGPSIQTSTGLPVYLPDTVIYSWNGTPYYSNPTPTRETADNQAYFVDVTGFGGWIAAGISQEIVTVNFNEDVLIVGFTNRQTRLAYTGDDILPFVFFSINSEQLGSISTFSSINLDRGVLSMGEKGLTQTSQISTKRIDLAMPDQIFTVQAANNGADRVNSVRDYLNEWVYFSYPVNGSQWKFPTQTFMYNYREETWSILIENYTARGTFRRSPTSGQTWASLPYEAWTEWTDPWNSGAGSPEFPNVIGGNQQGFVMLQDIGTGEGPSGYIQAISVAPASSTYTQFTSPNHCLLAGDYLLIEGIVGTGDITNLNGLIGMVQDNSTQSPLDQNTFVLDIVFPGGTYLGNGTFTRLSSPFIQTKQFNPFWEEGRQTRLGAQRYLFDKTASGQVTVNINLSQDSDTTWNAFPPNVGPANSSLEYSQVVFTCPEGTNLGLTEANTNLQMPVATSADGSPQQVWHRMNTSLIGDSVQLTITLSDAQMRNLVQASSEIALHAIHMMLGRGPYLA